MPPVPASFPQLESMASDDLQTLLAEPAARSAFLAGAEEVRLLEASAASLRDAASRAANVNLAAAEALRGAGEALAAAQATAAAKEKEVADLAARQEAAAARFSAPRVAGELEATAAALAQAAEELVDSFERSATGFSAFGDGTPAAGAAGGVSAAALRRFSEDFIALRKRHHLARAKAYILGATGYAQPAPVR